MKDCCGKRNAEMKENFDGLNLKRTSRRRWMLWGIAAAVVLVVCTALVFAPRIIGRTEEVEDPHDGKPPLNKELTQMIGQSVSDDSACPDSVIYAGLPFEIELLMHENLLKGFRYTCELDKEDAAEKTMLVLDALAEAYGKKPGLSIKPQRPLLVFEDLNSEEEIDDLIEEDKMDWYQWGWRLADSLYAVYQGEDVNFEALEALESWYNGEIMRASNYSVFLGLEAASPWSSQSSRLRG